MDTNAYDDEDPFEDVILFSDGSWMYESQYLPMPGDEDRIERIPVCSGDWCRITERVPF